MNLPSNLPALLRAAGLTVVEVDGWRTRGRPASTGSFAPVGVLNHHTGASAKGWGRLRELVYAKWMFLTGRPESGLPAPLCQIALGRTGVVYLGAAGRANHAGTARASGSVAAGDGNSLYIGIEWMLSGTERIPRRMRRKAVLLNAVLTKEVTKTSEQTVSCHYNTSVTGKWDIGTPDGVAFGSARVLDIVKFREDVRKRRLRLGKPEPEPEPKPEPKPEPAGSKVSLALINIAADLGETAWEACFRLAAQAAVFGLNESVADRQEVLYSTLAEELGFEQFGLDRCPNPIFWDRKHARKVHGEVHEIHPAGTGRLAKRFPGYNSARSINEVVLELRRRRATNLEVAILNTHLVPNGKKVDAAWRFVVRRRSKRMLRRMAQAHHNAGRAVVVMGDMNIHKPFSLGPDLHWLHGTGIDKIGANRKGTAATFPAPNDHRHGGVRATIIL